MECPKCGSKMRYTTGKWWSGWCCPSDGKHDIKDGEGTETAAWTKEAITGSKETRSAEEIEKANYWGSGFESQ